MKSQSNLRITAGTVSNCPMTAYIWTWTSSGNGGTRGAMANSAVKKSLTGGVVITPITLGKMFSDKFRSRSSEIVKGLFR